MSDQTGDPSDELERLPQRPKRRPRGRKRGRPTKLTPEIQAQIANYLKAGCYVETAAAAAGIDKATLLRWLKNGARSCGAQRKFRDAVTKALADAELTDLLLITRAAKKGAWQAAAWKRERSNPARWGRRQQAVSDVLDATDKPSADGAANDDPAATCGAIAASALRTGDLPMAMAAAERAAHLRGLFPTDRASLARVGLDDATRDAVESRGEAIMAALKQVTDAGGPQAVLAAGDETGPAEEDGADPEP